ncbi:MULTISPECIES: hypothetical protein [Priestia]|uniref:Uncharacterized protein n=1 Tax=Priestia megaterium (strain WSH-002) TaxID=1006007 RepID=A0A8D3X266_PRIMW|nr:MULTISPECIES: hypothetical protein [Priestia]AEN89684.1 hypothetical protein BMWSH_2802 [Priestia megaterium WSH-002]PHF77492.1 hypothetical protein COI42_03625 [Priestia aryabhattai]
MTEKQKTRLEELMKQVVIERRSLSKKELKELHSLLAMEIAELEAQKKEANSDRFSLVVDIGFYKGMQKKVVKLQERKPLGQQLEDQIAFMEKAIQQMETESTQLKEKREQEQFYKQYEEKYNRDIDNVF